MNFQNQILVAQAIGFSLELLTQIKSSLSKQLRIILGLCERSPLITQGYGENETSWRNDKNQRSC